MHPRATNMQRRVDRPGCRTPQAQVSLVDAPLRGYDQPMKAILTTTATDLIRLAEAEDVVGVVVLADKKSQAITVYSFAALAAQRDALERAQKLLRPKRKAMN